MLSITQFDPVDLVSAPLLHAPRPLSHVGLELFGTLLSPMVEPLRPPALDEVELILHVDGGSLISGRIDLRFQTHVQPGMLFVVPRGMPTEWQLHTACTVLNLFLTPALLGQVAHETADCDPTNVEFVPHVAAVDRFLMAVGRALLDAVQTQPTNDSLAAETLTHALTVHLLRRYTSQPLAIAPLRGKMPPRTLQRVFEYIHANLGQRLMLAELAAIAHLSPYHFARQFRATVGQPPHRYVLDQRLVAARELLGEHTLSLAMVAARLGFADQSHLSFHFKRRYGVPPGAFARK